MIQKERKYDLEKEKPAQNMIEFYLEDTIVDYQVTQAFANLFHPVQMDRIRFVQMDIRFNWLRWTGLDLIQGGNRSKGIT